MDYSRDIDKLRHTCAHVMAQAVQELWPDTKVTIGPAIENGFYYDFDKKDAFSDDDLKAIEKKMHQIINKKPMITHEVWGRDKAIEYFRDKGETYKVELIEGLPDKEVSIYKTGDAWLDLCKGPHVNDAGQIKAFKLLSVAGAYWRGSENNKMLQRIYGTAFPGDKELKEYLNMLQEAEKRDHRKLGVQLDLFNIYHEVAGAGLVFYHPRGAMLRKIIEDYIREQHIKRGYDLVMTPHMLKGKLWELTGHAQNYRENMYYLNVDDEEYVVKPMNCPGHCLIYRAHLHSYRELPIRFFELGTVYRQEKAGVLHGLLRVRGFTQDDAHIFCREDQIKDEVMKVLDFVFNMMSDFGFKDLEIELSTRPEKFIGTVETWDAATKSLKDSLETKKIAYQINEGDGAFYGPKIDIKLKDAIGRSWQCGTIQCDFFMPERLDLSYINEAGAAVRPVMIHRALLGSIERFIGTLIEHYAGAFPTWLAPIQAVVIPITPAQSEYGNRVKDDLQNHGLRVIIDERNESLGKRIRESTVKKIPYLLIIGDKEIQDNKVAVRHRTAGDQGAQSLEEFVKKIQDEVTSKK